MKTRETESSRSLHFVGRLRATTARERALEKKMKALKDYIRREGVLNDTCTYDVLGEICEGCRCKRQPQPTAEVSHSRAENQKP